MNSTQLKMLAGLLIVVVGALVAAGVEQPADFLDLRKVFGAILSVGTAYGLYRIPSPREQRNGEKP